MDSNQFLDDLENQLDNAYNHFLVSLEGLKAQVGQGNDQQLIKEVEALYQGFKNQAFAIEAKLTQTEATAQHEIDNQKITDIRAKIESMNARSEKQKQQVISKN